MLLEKRRTLPQRILLQIRIDTHQSERRKTDQSGDCNKARCKRVVVAVGNCTRAMCVRARRCLCSSTESARSPPLRLYIPRKFVRWSRECDFAPVLLLVFVQIVKPVSIHPALTNRADSLMSAQVRSGVGVTSLNNTADQQQLLKSLLWR